jgi:hypothetical protein
VQYEVLQYGTFLIEDENMDKHLNEIIENAKKRAAEITGTTAAVRGSFAIGRPNSSKESTQEGTLRAFETIVSAHTPKGYTRKS